jgi:hypothetical protein
VATGAAAWADCSHVDALVDFTEIKHIYQNVGVVGA